MREEISLNATQTIYTLCDTYRGPWLLPRAVILKDDIDEKPLAIGDLTISRNDHFIKMHPHGFPGVMTAEFTQQLGLLIIRKTLGIKGLPFMLKVEMDSRLAINFGDTVTAVTKLIKTKGKKVSRMGFFFESVVTREDSIVMKTTFNGMPVPIQYLLKASNA